jgi:cell pole-organizing protein PopZ
MPEAKPHSEPSMEEIIASISRVITEDKHPGKRAADVRVGVTVPASVGKETDILELTQAVNEDGSVRRITSHTEPAPAPAAEPGATADASAADAAARLEPRLDAARERILSDATSGAAAAAFAQLGALPRDRRRDAEMPLGGAERTLEEIVRDMMRPMLQSWLDEHLPAIVERLVREEIARVVGEAGLR